MSEHHRSRIHFYCIAVACLGLSACSSFSGGNAPERDLTTRMLTVVTPYKIDIVQGNVVTREQVALLKPGMPRNAVREVLGTPLLASVFHEDRWDFVFTLRRQGFPAQSRKVTVYFKNDLMDRVEADALPSESEFVSTLKTDNRSGPGPALQASEEELKKFPPPKPLPPPAEAPPPVDYPPLESSPK
ncbi:MAG: outer membrane protein assembly factor BamE [Rhodoferax sp.]|nr:outer membrane protein assembly factor BamE [Rhodoferax sp.]